MEEQKKSEPFSKIALDAAQAAAHHQRHEGSRLVESLNCPSSSTALRQAVTRESMNLESGPTCSPPSVRPRRSSACSARCGASTVP